MIPLQDGEEVMRETRGSTKKYGRGIFYITNQRVFFESEKNSQCFDLTLHWLFDWLVTENSVIIRWRLLPEGRADFRAEDPIRKIEIELECIKPEKGDMGTPGIIHYTLFYAYTNSHDCVGRLGYGWLTNEKNELVHLFDETRNPYTSQKKFDQRDITRGVIEDIFIDDGTGDEKLDRLIFESHTMLTAWQKNGEFGNGFGRLSEYMSKKRMEEDVPKMLNERIEEDHKKIAETEAKIVKLKETGDTVELEKVIQTDWTDKLNGFGRVTEKITSMPTGNIYMQLEHQKKCLKASMRIKEIIQEIKFDYYKQLLLYEDTLRGMLMKKLYKNEDISTYSPEIEKAPDYTIEAKWKINERRRNFNNKQTR